MKRGKEIEGQRNKRPRYEGKVEDGKREGSGLKQPKNKRHIKKAERLAEASKKVRKESLRVNREFAAIEQAPNGRLFVQDRTVPKGV